MAENRTPKGQAPGRRANAALPLGEREGDDTAAKAVGDTFKPPSGG